MRSGTSATRSQKNGVVVRQVVGHGRLVGEHAYRQLDELYRAIHWYVNCFQPSMKLVSKQVEGRTIHRIYDAAKTPLQRVLLSGVLPPSQQQEVRAIGKALDPLRLFQQVAHLQQAIFRCDAGRSSASQPIPSLVPFDLTGCAAEFVLLEAREADAWKALPPDGQESAGVLNWRRTSKDPFAGQWEHILAWVRTNPTRSGGDILRELQSRFPGHYEDSHLRTLQRGLRKIRAYVLQTLEEAEPPEGLLEYLLFPTELKLARPAPESLTSSSLPVCEDIPSPKSTSTRSSDPQRTAEESSARPIRKKSGTIPIGQTPSKSDPAKMVRRAVTTSARSAPQIFSPGKGQYLTIERAIQDYLQAHRTVGHRSKTLEWHQMVLSHLQHYLQTKCHLLLVNQITETAMRNWLASLEQTPTMRGSQRSASTVETYARSARAFCGWLVEREVLSCSPLSKSAFPRISAPLPHVVSPAIFEQAMRAGFSQHTQVRGTKRLIARDRALLWALFDTGITVTELCALRVADLDLKTGLLHVRGKGGRERQLTLGPTCLSHLRSYLRQMDPTTRKGLARRKAGGDPLFGTQGKQPLTRNGVTMVCARFRKRAGVRETTFSPQVLRHSFALRYLQAGGNPRGLQELLGYEGMAPVRQYLRWYHQLLHEQTRA